MKQDNNIGKINSVYLDPNLDRVREIFNYYIARLYSDMGFLLDEQTKEQIYPVVYGYMHTILERSIKNDINPYEFNKQFPIHASRAVKVAMKMNDINPVSPRYTLSMAYSNEIQRDITISIAPDIIALNLNIDDNKVKMICNKYNIKESEYNRERDKVFVNISKMYKDNFGIQIFGKENMKKRLKK